ncbi:MAG: hypothetical protein GY765_11565, partial [bacterium]|nr:hypothetical protein [bacterium]
MRIIMRQWILLIICLGLCAGFVRAQAVGAVSGRVVESGVTGIAGAEVVVYGINYNYLSSGTTDAGGYYNLPDVAVGECKVHFPAGSAGNYQHQWYNGKHFFDEADTIIVTENSTTLLPTVILEPGGIISGRVLDEQGNGLAGVYVEVHVIDSTMGWGNTDENGYFTVNALPGKECRIYFDTFGTSNHTPEWYNDKKSFDEADWVYVNVGQTVELRDTVLSRGGILSGLLMAEYGSIYGDAYVEVYDESNNFIRSVMVGEDDGYRVDGLPAGTYKLKFTTYGGTLYLDEWYQNKATFETADPIVLAGGETLDLGTEILDKAVDIGGDVKDSRGNGIAGVYVGVYDLDYNYMGSTYTDEIGDFRIRGLEHRDSKIYFEPGGAGNCLPQWLRRKETFEEADIMETSSGSMTFSSVILEDGGGVSGRMTDAGGNGVPNARVDVFNTDYDYLAGAVTDENGDYNVNGIPQGLCKINFSGSSGNYLSEWYNDKADFDHADTVMVTVGQTVTINAQLATGGGLSGRVTASTGTGLADVQVTVHGSGGDYVNSIFSDSEGYYTMEGIAPGVCKVFFDTYAAGNYVGQWYNNKNSYEAADEIGITAGQTTILEDARLESGGMISGRVTDIVGNGLSQVYVYVYGPEYDFKGMTVTDDTGYYSVQHLKVGESKILFEPYMAGNYTTQWYNNRDSFINADAVYVNAGQQLTVENTVLNEGAVINGRIADAGGNGIGDVFVDVYDYAYNYLGGTFSNGDGYYSVTALPTSNCKIYF